MSSTVATFEHIIRRQSTKELMSLLLQMDKKEIVAVRAKAKSLYKELDEYKSTNGTWARAMQPQQNIMLFLAGLATYSRKEALTRSFSMPWEFTRDHNHVHQVEMYQEQLMSVLEHARPDWLADWFERTTRANEWQAPEYALLRKLESRDLLPYHPWLFAKSLAHLLNTHSWLLNDLRQDRSKPALPLPILEQLQHDATLLQRDLPLLFDYDTAVDSAAIYNQDENSSTTWLQLLPQLVASGHLDRADLLTRSLLALRRDFRRPLLTWFRNLFGALQPTADERRARQAELVELLAHPLPLVVNFALDQLKDLWARPDFQADNLLLYADALMTRQDLKTGLKTLLSGFSKLVKAYPAQALAIGRLSTAALAHADADLQARAAKVLAELLHAKKPLLSTAEAAEISEGLNQYADLLAPATRQVLAPWLAAEPPTAPVAAAAAYAPRTDYIPELSAATAIVPVGDWHELLFLTGQVLQHNDPTALERWLDGLLRLQPQFPADGSQALQPYVLQILPYLKGRTEKEMEAVFKNPALADGYIGLVQALTLSWAQGFRTPLVPLVKLRNAYQSADPLVALEQHRLAFAEQLLRQQQALPLLSTPTHAPHWVAPTTLVQKLLAYEALNQEPNTADLTLALARLAQAHPAEATAARALLPQLRHEGLRELLHWQLDAAGAPLPTAIIPNKPLLKQFTERLARLLPEPAPTAPANLAEALPCLWAVAARTKQPTGKFPELDRLTAVPCANVAQPWQPRWELQRKSNTYIVKWKPGKPEVTERWTELHLLAEPTNAVVPSGLLLYSFYSSFKLAEKQNIWQFIGPLFSDYSYLAAMLPQYPAPLHWHTLRLAATRDTTDSTTRDVVSQALRTLLGPGARFEEPATVLLAVGLTHNAAICRGLALEVLLAAVEQQRLVPAGLGRALGQLLAAEFVPVQRLTDGLAQARGIDATTEDALRQTLEALLPELPAEPPRNVRKLLEAYVDLTTRARQPVPAAVQARLREWSTSAALKKAAAPLLV